MNIEELKRLAEAATPGHWTTDLAEHDMPYQDVTIRSGSHGICQVWIDDAPCHDYNAVQLANAAYIAAANPAAILELIAERDALKLRDVSNILIDVVPGEDGMSREVYAQSTDQVVEVLTKLSEQCDTLQMERDALKAELERIKALEPVMVYHGACTIDCGEHGHHDTEMLKMIPAGTKLYALGSKTDE